MAKITVIHSNESLDYVAVGSVIKFEKETTNAYDAYAIKASYKGNNIGYVSAGTATSAPGTSNNKEIYADVNDVFEGKVVDHFAITRRTTKTVLIVDIETGGVSASSDEETMFTLRVKGSQTAYPSKAEVIKDHKAGNRVYLDLKLEKGKIIAYKDGVPAGAVDEKEYSTTSSLEEIEVLKTILEENDLEAKVTKCEATAYFLSVSISNSIWDEAKTTATKKVLTGIKADLVTKGFDEVVLSDIESYLLANNFTADDIQDIFATYEVYPSNVAWRIPTKPATMFEDTFEGLVTAFSAINNGFHILCSGEKGTGKNVFIETLAYVYQRPLYSISVSRETDKYDLLGSKTIDVEVNEDGVAENKVSFHPEVLLEAMEVGGILNIDEINFADAGVTGLLHSIGDDRKSIEVPGYKFVKGHKNFLMMGTMNIGYQGTSELNEALQDRFVDILFPNNDSIFNILSEKCLKAKKADLQKADKVYKKMISIVRDRDALLDENCITVRGFIQAGMMSTRLGMRKALEVCVANKVKDEEYRQNIVTIIDSLV